VEKWKGNLIQSSAGKNDTVEFLRSYCIEDDWWKVRQDLQENLILAIDNVCHDWCFFAERERWLSTCQSESFY
jgi:hypothetical protein